MSQLVALGIVIGLAIVGLGLQALTRALRDTPVDTMPPGPLIRRPTSEQEIAPPPSLSTTEQLVEDARFSPASARQRLWPEIVAIARDRGVEPQALQPPHGDLHRWLRDTLDVLEAPAQSDTPRHS